MLQQNAYGQPIDPTIENWTPRPLPSRTPLIGRTCRVEPVDVERHVDDLFAAHFTAPDDRDWTYLSLERPTTEAAFAACLADIAASPDPLHYAVIDTEFGKAVGTAALMRTDRDNGSIEVGFVRWSPLMQRRIATLLHGSGGVFWGRMRRVPFSVTGRGVKSCCSKPMPSVATASRSSGTG